MKTAWRMILSEPYRVFFPAGMIAGIFGVMMWPMLYAGWIQYYPGEAHTRMMIEGFMGAFVIGFLGTSFPRLTGNRSWLAGEFMAILALWLMTVVSHATSHVAAGDAAFSALLGVLLMGMMLRWASGNRDTPPPGFVLAISGILAAAIAAGLLSHARLSATQIHWAKLWLFQGFPLPPLMGISPYVLPRFFGWDSKHSLADSPTPPDGWWQKVILSIIAGILITVSFALEVSGKTLLGHGLRAVVVIIWFALETPILRSAKTGTTPGNACRWALLGIATGWIAVCFWPHARAASLHLFFASELLLSPWPSLHA